MKRLLMVAIALLLAHQTALAADITVVAEETAEHPALILVKGQFMKDQQSGDVGLFSALVADLRGKTALIFLDSPGGQVLTGTGIGRIIHQHGLSTVVADGVRCTSACALAWLAGKERFMGATARVGFHAISHENGEVSSEGNAWVGAYLYEIGLTQPNTITYLTMSPPNSMAWISKSLGQAFEIPIQQPIPFVDAPWAKPALLSWLRSDNPVVKTEAKTETIWTTIGVTGHVIRIPLKGSPLDVAPASLLAAKPIVPQVRFRRFESSIPRPPDQAAETRDTDTAQK